MREEMASKAENERCISCNEEHPQDIGLTDSCSELKGLSNEENTTKLDKVRKAFTDFCRSTSLHGWQHLSESPIGPPTIGRKYIWMMIVAASIGVASFFIFTSVTDFTSKYVVTNIDTTTAPLRVSSSIFLMQCITLRKTIFLISRIKHFAILNYFCTLNLFY